MIALALTLVLAGADGGTVGAPSGVTEVRVLGVQGAGVDVASLTKALRTVSAPLNGCYEDRLVRADPTGTGRLAFTLTPEGRALDVKVALDLKGLAGEDVMADCLMNATRQWALPFFPPAPVKVEAELTFRRPRALPRRGQGQCTIQLAKFGGTEAEAEALEASLATRKASIVGCFEKAPNRQPGLKQVLAISFVITPDGRSADITPHAAPDDPVAPCVKAVVRGWSFPMTPAARTNVSLGLSFTEEK